MPREYSDFKGQVDPKSGSLPFNPLVSRGPIRWLMLCGIMLIAAIALVTAFAIGSFRQRALEAHQHELENTLALLARHFDQQLTDFLLVQQGIAADLQRSRISEPDVFKSEMSTLDVHEELRAKINRSSDFASARVYSSEGLLINTSETWPVPTINIADRKYFSDLKAIADSTNLVAVVRSRVIDKWTLIFATKLVGPNGEFMGVLTRGIDSEVFEDFFRSMGVPPGGAVGLFHADGTMLARYPRAESSMGQNFSAGPVHQPILARSDHGTIRLKSPIDGLDGLAAARRLSRFPISIIATTTVAVSYT